MAQHKTHKDIRREVTADRKSMTLAKRKRDNGRRSGTRKGALAAAMREAV